MKERAIELDLTEVLQIENMGLQMQQARASLDNANLRRELLFERLAAKYGFSTQNARYEDGRIVEQVPDEGGEDAGAARPEPNPAQSVGTPPNIDARPNFTEGQN